VITLREFRPGDEPPLLALFRNTIRRVNARDYSAEQVAAWAPDDLDERAWADRFAGRFVIVAEAAGEPVGFGELEPGGHLDRLFVAADHLRRGIGQMILEALIAEARRRSIARLTVDASITARRFFERAGFRTVAQQTVTRRGVSFVNYRMEMALA
jgi:putative acetyltransferase